MRKIGIIIPAHNEEKMIKNSLNRLSDFMNSKLQGLDYVIYAVDNSSSDKTAEKIKEVADGQKIQYLFQAQKGKGAAIRLGMLKGLVDSCDTLCFMDADLATDPGVLPELLNASESGAALGDRYHANSIVKRSAKRLVVSKVYRFIAQSILNSEISDLPCGRKAFSAEAVKLCLPKVENNSWFFDSELAYLVEQNGFPIKNIPVKWEDVRPAGEKSKVNIFSVSLQYLKELSRLRRKRLKV